MKLLGAVFILCTLLVHTWKSAAAQVVPAAVGPGAYVAVGAGLSGFQAVYGQQHLAGALIYADVHPEWRVGLEGEARFLRYHSSEDVNESNYLGGVRVVILERHRMEPYIKFLAGMGRITLPFGYAHGSFLDYAPGAGLDIPINSHISLRAIDFEYQHWPQFPFGSFSPYGISSSIRVRVTPRAWLPTSVHKRRVHV